MLMPIIEGIKTTSDGVPFVSGMTLYWSEVRMTQIDIQSVVVTNTQEWGDKWDIFNTKPCNLERFSTYDAALTVALKQRISEYDLSIVRVEGDLLNLKKKRDQLDTMLQEIQ